MRRWRTHHPSSIKCRTFSSPRWSSSRRRRASCRSKDSCQWVGKPWRFAKGRSSTRGDLEARTLWKLRNLPGSLDGDWRRLAVFPGLLNLSPSSEYVPKSRAQMWHHEWRPTGSKKRLSIKLPGIISFGFVSKHHNIQTSKHPAS